MEQEIKNDALAEVINVGTGQAATALSQILSQKVLINIPEIKFIPLENVSESLGGSDREIVSIFFNINGDLGGKILLVFDRTKCHYLTSLFVGEKAIKEEILSDIDQSCIMEIGNIIANSYLNGMAGLLDMTLLPSVPYFAEDMLGAVIDFLLIEISEISEYALFINTEMKIESEDLKGFLVIFPDEKFLVKIFQKLGINTNS